MSNLTAIISAKESIKD
jgi:hypothetical protein